MLEAFEYGLLPNTARSTPCLRSKRNAPKKKNGVCQLSHAWCSILVILCLPMFATCAGCTRRLGTGGADRGDCVRGQTFSLRRASRSKAEACPHSEVPVGGTIKICADKNVRETFHDSERP